jgi:S-formylglutathione hydrolase
MPETLSAARCFGGTQGFYRADSAACGGPMKFGVYVPPSPTGAVLYFLAGLTCTEETAAIKAGFQRVAAELGLTVVTPDTSPRDTGIEGATGDWEFGEAAGFYLDATQAPWSARFRMESFVVRELPAMVAQVCEIDVSRSALCGHSMGGHGALTLALRHPGKYRSVSAFAPIAAPSRVPWGEKAFSRYLGDDRGAWCAHDACALIADGARFPAEVLVDVGLADKFLDTQLQPGLLEAACEAAGQSLLLRRHAGYDHGYWFIQTRVEDHLRRHA